MFENLNKLKYNKIIIFNRWGNIVFQKIQYENDWGGTFKGKLLPAGSYYYILSVDQLEIRSALTILRD